jgi:digeranylgeranylglycerophospholipid reductase
VATVEKHTYDVVVVGGGPGGSCAAREAAKAGLKTLLVEKRQEIGTPVRCGEGIATAWLNEIGVQPHKEWIANEVEGARIFSPNEQYITLNAAQAGNETGFVVERDLFDKFLAREAIKAGADMWVKTNALGLIMEGGVPVGIQARKLNKDLEIRAPLIIAADGFESRVGLWAGIKTQLKPKDIEACLQYRLVGVDCDPRYNDFYIGSNHAPGGYLWIFPKGEGEANVGIGVSLASSPGMATAKTCLDAWIKRHPGYAKGKSIEDVAGAVSVSQPLKRTTANGVMLVGDAARLVDPLTGGGVANACVSGMHAGQVAKAAHDAHDFSEKFLQLYEEKWRDALEEQLMRNYMAKETLSRLTDDQLDKIVDALQAVRIDKVTTLEILKAVQAKYPEIVKEFEAMLAA